MAATQPEADVNTPLLSVYAVEVANERLTIGDISTDLSQANKIITKLGCSGRMARWCNDFFTWIIRIYAFPISFIGLFDHLHHSKHLMYDKYTKAYMKDAETTFQNMEQYYKRCISDYDIHCIAFGVFINTILIIVLLHIYAVLHTVTELEIGIAAFCFVLAILLLLDGYHTMDFSDASHKVKMHRIALKSKKQESDLREIDAEYLQILKTEKKAARKRDKGYNKVIWKCFDIENLKNDEKNFVTKQLRKMRQDNFDMFEHFVTHFVLLSLLIALTVAYIAALVIDIIDGEDVITSYIDLYTIVAVLMANIIGGYALINKVALWYLVNYTPESEDESE